MALVLRRHNLYSSKGPRFPFLLVRCLQARVQAHFYWPGIGQEVAKFVGWCDTCPKTVGRGRTKPTPLQILPATGSPYETVAIDLVGSTEPRAIDGSRYILTMVDFAKLLPEAVPLRNTEISTVAETLMNKFCRVAIPEQLLSDCCTQFTSEMMDEVQRLVACLCTLRTTPYNPKRNGLCERFNGTLKNFFSNE